MKNMIRLTISILTPFFMIMACSLPTTTKGSHEIPLSLARRIIPKKMSSQDMKQLLGEPNSIDRLESDPREIWIYLRSVEPTTRRMYAFVNPKSGLVESVTWNVFDEDPESNLGYLRNELGDPKLVKKEPKWLKGDAEPDEIYYRSEQLRLTISVRKTLNQVDMISWH